tara:strand:- start:4279 stop:4512 length:234 start_codon:yes stop_codon:yes gene_type:complete
MSQILNDVANSPGVTVGAATATAVVNVASYLGVITEWAGLVSMIVGIIACSALAVVHVLRARLLWQKIVKNNLTDEE